MKKVLNWLLNAVMIFIVAVAVAPIVLGVLFFIFLFVAIKTDALDGLSRSEAGIAAMEASQLSAYVEYAPYHCLTIDDTLTLFSLAKYDNHVDNTDLRAGLMALAADTDGWHIEPVTATEYAACIPTEADFLLPIATFDAWFESADTHSFFDQESGLFVNLRMDEAPKPGTIRADKLTVPHNGYVYTMETHGGFHGDGTTFYALIVPEEKRAAFETTLAAHADWHEGTVTQEEYAVLQKRFYEYPGLLPSADVTFDWWSHVDTYARSHPDEEPDFDVHPDFPAVMREAGARWSLNWLCALYDADTGLFVYYQSDS